MKNVFSIIQLKYLLLTGIVASGIIGCGRETKIYTDPAPVVTTPETPATRNGRSVLPEDFYDHSVNRGQVDIALDGAEGDSIALRLLTRPGSNDAGSFNGSGQGNRAILGVSSYDNNSLSSISAISFDAKNFMGTEQVSVLILVDMTCNDSAPRIFSINGSAISSVTDVDNGYKRYRITLTDESWQVSGSALMDPDNSAVTLVPSTSDPTRASLSALLSKYPNACLRNAATSDDSLPKGAPTSAVLFALGDPSTTSANGVFINRLTIGDDVYAELE